MRVLIFSLAQFILTAFSAEGSVVNIASLELIHVVWRHGDRTPFDVFPTDVHNNPSTWPQGLLQLTRLGVRQQFLLGEYIKTRYKGFLSEDYSAFELNVVSADENRTLMSAEANCAGAYPPPVDLEWKTAWLDHTRPSWYPVPVHTSPPDKDPMLNTNMSCPTYAHRIADIMNSPPVQKIMLKNHQLFDFLRRKTGLPLPTLMDILLVYDPLFVERIHNRTHTWPSWMNNTLWKEIESLCKLSLTFYSPTVETQRLRGGLLLGDILERLNERARGTLDARFKYKAYSAFHESMVALLSAFGAYDGFLIPYASAIFIELHRVGSKHFVELYFYNETDHDPYQLAFRECGFRCPLYFLTGLMKDKIPSDWYGECGFETLEFANAQIEDLQSVRTGLTIALVCFILVSVSLCLALLCRFVSPSRSGYASIDE